MSIDRRTPPPWLALLFVFLISTLLSACDGGSASPTAQQAIKHVFVITLENENYATIFGPNSAAPYLSRTLVSKGAHIEQYYGTGHASLDNYIAMISGQPSTKETINDCELKYLDFVQTGTTADGFPIGTGCVYPATVKTLVDQLTYAGYTWKGYEGDMGNDPTREDATCGHPPLNDVDLTNNPQAPSADVPLGDSYATRHNPFMYFHSIIDSPSCAKNVVNLNRLSVDLREIETTANFNFITPSTCDDGHDSPCANGAPGGLMSADSFLKTWVPIITSSPAFQKDGLLIINFDESSYASLTTGIHGVTLTYSGDTCCSQQKGPNLPEYPLELSSGLATLNVNNYGGDRTGAVLISKYIKPGTVTTVPYNHYSMLRSLEDIFGLSYLGYAAQAGLVPFGDDIYTNPAGQ